MNFYEILEVDKDATQEIIEKQYRKKAFQYHPDRNPGDTEMQNKFIEVQKAYEVLRDSGQRQNYDFSLTNRGFMPSFDFFEQENLDIKIIQNISILDSLNGTNKEIKISRKSPCQPCRGFGASKFQPCNNCNGSGQTLNAMHNFFRFQSLCGKCMGHGKVPLNRCESCHGSKKTNLPEETFQITIPLGLQNGMTLCLHGCGNLGTNNSGNLYVQCVFDNDPVFRVDGLNILCSIKARYSTMLFGGKLQIPTPENEIIEVDVPQNTQCLTKLTIKNKGMFDFINSHNRGDIIATVMAEIPQNLENSDELKRFLISHGL